MSTKSDKNNEKVCANWKSSTLRRKQPSDSHNEVTDMMKGTPKVRILMELSLAQSLQIAFSSVHRGIFKFMVMQGVLLSHKTHFVWTESSSWGENLEDGEFNF